MYNITLNHDPDLILRCYWEWRRSGYQVWPEINEVANRNQAYSDDMMTIDRIFTAFEARLKSKKKAS
jgi:hypothetical protein